jgi:hypothetical protein
MLPSLSLLPLPSLVLVLVLVPPPLLTNALTPR